MLSKLLVCVMFLLTVFATAPARAVLTGETKNPTKSAPAAVGSYMLYLQAKQEMDYAAAINFLYDALKEDPENPSLTTEMFALLAFEGRIKEAFPFAQTELKRNPASLLPALISVAYHAKSGDYKAALKQIESYPEREENAFLFPLLEVWVRAGLNDRKKAESALSKLNRRGTESLYFFHAALLQDFFDDPDAARENFESLLGEPGGLSLRAAQAYGNFLLRHGDDKKFKALLTAYRKNPKTYALIDESFFTAGGRSAGRRVPKSVSTPNAGLAEAFFDISGSLSEKGTPETSIFFIRTALALDSGLSLARSLLGEQLEKEGRYDEALKLYEAETETSETYFNGQIRAAVILARKGDLGNAEKRLRFLADKRNDSTIPWTTLGEAMIEAKKYDRAVSAYTEALNRTGVLTRADWVLLYSRGTAYERAGKWAEAEEDLQRALLLSPDQPLTLNYLGYSWLERGKNITEATKMLEQAVRMAPDDGYIADSLGWAYYLRKQYAKACEILEKAVEASPGSAVINDHLGDAYWRVGRKREARFQWKKALVVNDDLDAEGRGRVELKLEKGLDAVGDKIAVVMTGKKKK